MDQTDSQSDGSQPGVKDMAAAAPAEASKVASTAVDAGKGVAGEAAAQVSTVLDQAKQQFSSVSSQAKDELNTQLESRGAQAASALQTLSGQLSALGDGRPGDAGPLPSLISDLEGRVKGWAQLLEDGGPRAVGERVVTFARRRPVVFLLASGAAGFAAGRLVRSGAAVQQQNAPSSSAGQPGEIGTSRVAISGPAVSGVAGGDALVPASDATFGDPVELGVR